MNTAMNNPVGRPRSFDEEQVLLTVMDVFWRKGYEATSMKDILEATGLHKGSIYQTFGDKHKLFVRALGAYISNMRATMTQLLDDAESPLEGLRLVLYHHIELGAKGEGRHQGCLALNSVVEMAQHDEEVMNMLGNAFQMRFQKITQAVTEAQESGDLRSDWAPERITRLILAGESGVMVQVKGMLAEENAKAAIDDLLSALG